MTVISDMLAWLSDDAPVASCRVGPRLAVVQSRRVGLASVLRSDPSESSTLVERSARQLANRLRSVEPAEASVGLAAFNSLAPPGPGALEGQNAYRLILEHGAGKRVTVVGHFPFVERLRSHVRELWVLELVPGDDDLPADEAPSVVPRSDVVAITGSSLVNHSLDQLLELAHGKYVVVLGPSTPLCPVLFDYGVVALGGTVVDDPDHVVRQVLDGVAFRDIEGVHPVLWRRD
jgi:uncharacterized protein (DUF4213/DUF364 family)